MSEAFSRHFWMEYFAMRAAPLGPVQPAVVTSSEGAAHKGGERWIRPFLAEERHPYGAARKASAGQGT